jgi:hypothetical protein
MIFTKFPFGLRASDFSFFRVATGERVAGKLAALPQKILPFGGSANSASYNDLIAQALDGILHRRYLSRM